MKRPDRRELERELRGLRAPEEEAALMRGVELLGAALRTGLPRAPARRRALKPALVATAIVVATIGLTPAGASVRDWIGETIGVGMQRERPALTRLPSEGEVLASSRSGAWIVHSDGSRRRLGPYREATWSPGALFVAATRKRQLVAVDPVGEVRWTISRPARVTDPRWAPSGFRVAYRSGTELRVVAGDGTGDHLLAGDAAQVPPEWRPAPAGSPTERNVLAFADRRGRVVVIDADSGGRLWSARPAGGRPVALGWLKDRSLVVGTGTAITVLDDRGRESIRLPQPRGTVLTDLATSPTSPRVAVLRRRSGPGLTGSAELATVRLPPGPIRSRTLVSGPGEFRGITFSPDGEWLLVGWRDADQWLFVRLATNQKLLKRVIAVGDVARQFDPGGDSTSGFPIVEGWCCPG